jgi:ribonuclease HI
VKINWDAAVDSERGMIRMGIIARDHSGRVIAAQSGPKNFFIDRSLAEALAAREAVELGRSLGPQDFILEGDALEVVKAINQTEPSRGLYGQAINDIKFLMSQGGRWTTRHIYRAGNGAAHALAKMGLQFPETQRWLNVLSESVDVIVRAEQCL